MPLLIPYIAPPTPPTVSLTVTAPAFQVTFYNGTTTVQISTVLTIQTSLGRTSPRTDGSAAGTATITVDDTARILDADNSSSPLYGKLTPGGTTTVQVTVWNGTSYIPLFTGLIEQIDTSWPGGTSYSEAQISLVDQQRDLNLQIPASGVKYPLQQSGARISQLIGAPSRSGWAWANRSRSGASAIDAGQKDLGPLVTDGTTSTWSYAADAASAEKGLIFFDQAGVISFHDQLHRYHSSTPAWVFGDSTSEIQIDPSLSLSLPNDRIVTDIAYATSDGITSGYGPSGVFFWATNGTDSLSQVSSVTTQLADQMQGYSRARWEYNHYSINRRDAPNLAIDALVGWPSLTSPSPFSCAINAKISDFCQFNRRPSGSTITKYYWIDGVAHNIQAGQSSSWTTTFTMLTADAIPNLYRLGVDPLTSMTAPLPW
jgi:hypothetical protein